MRQTSIHNICILMYLSLVLMLEKDNVTLRAIGRRWSNNRNWCSPHEWRKDEMNKTKKGRHVYHVSITEHFFFLLFFFCHRLKMRHSNVFVYFYIFYLFLEFSASTRFGWKKMKLSCENGNLDERFENQSAASRKVVMLTQTQIQTHTKSRRRTNLMNVTKKKMHRFRAHVTNRLVSPIWCCDKRSLVLQTNSLRIRPTNKRETKNH